MNFNLKKTSPGNLSSLLDTISEQAVDIDFILPDYCPDIEKILRCKITPKIYNRSVSGGQLQIDGATVVTVMYVDGQNNNIRACEQSVPFNGVFQLKDTPENFIIETSAKPEYANCRALSPRRLTVHGAFSLYIKIMCKGELTLTSPDEQEDLECKTQEISCTSLCVLSQEVFSAGDELTVNNKPPVEVVLESDVKASITDFRIIPDKLMLSGELSVKMLYLSNVESAQPQQIDYIIPFSQIVESGGLTEEVTAFPYINVLSFDVRLKSDMLSESPVINVDAKLSASVYGYKDVSVPVVTDAYSTKLITEAETQRVTVTAGVNMIKDSFIQKEEISLDGTDIFSICDVSNDYCTLSPVITERGITLNSKMNICILAFDEEKNPVYLERSIEFAKEIEVDSPFNSINNVISSVASLSYRIGDNNSLELRCEIRYMITLMNNETYTMISQICAEEENTIEKDNFALTLYFADEGESLWDIAKEYNTRKQLILDENSLEDDVLNSPKMLLIPTV